MHLAYGKIMSYIARWTTICGISYNRLMRTNQTVIYLFDHTPDVSRWLFSTESVVLGDLVETLTPIAHMGCMFANDTGRPSDLRC